MQNSELARKTAVIASVAVGVIAAALLLWRGASLFLILFAGILFAVFLRSVADWIHGVTPLSRRVAVLLTTLVLVTAIVAMVWFMAPRISEQWSELSTAIPDAISDLRSRVGDNETLARTMERLEQELVLEPEQVGGLVRGLLGGATAFLVFGFVGFYLAFTPRIYEEGLIRLIPPSARERTEEVLLACRSTLAWWLVGRLASMVIIGVLTWVGLMMIDIPLALILGVIAGLFSFVPYIGPFFSAIPAVVLGLAQDVRTGAVVVGLYLVVQLIESYLLTPQIEKRTVWLPPALTILAQVLMGLLFGAMGILVATPLLAVVVVLVKMLLIEDRYHEQIEVSRAGG